MASRKRPPIWGQPAPGSRKPKLTREQIARAALSIADREGFDAVSMRRIADELDVGTMTLYYYVRTKDDLIALMDDALMGEALVPAGKMPATWREGLVAIARGSYRAFRNHPWALRSLHSTGMGPHSLLHVDQSMQAVDTLPLELPGKLEVLAIVDDFVFGHVLRATEKWSEIVVGSDRKQTKDFAAFTTAQMATGEYPYLERLLGGDDPVEAFVRFGKLMGDEGRFDRGLEVILDGVEARLLRKKRTR